MTFVDFEPALRLLAAIAVGVTVGLNRDMKGKPTGVRTLGLVAFGAAVVTVAATRYAPLLAEPDALSRVVQGLIQGVLAGVGFIGAGVILRGQQDGQVHGLTTAASVWVTAAMGIVCGLGDWELVGLGLAMMLALLLFGGNLERVFERRKRPGTGRRGDEG